MFSKIKKSLGVLAFGATILASTSLVYAASGEYESTYNMTGGVYSKYFDVGSDPTFTVYVYPEIGVEGSNISLYLERKTTFGHAGVDSGSVSSTVNDSEKLYGDNDAQYRIYYRNWTGHQMKGDTTIKWSY
ncbi:hypothetical protein [Bacillus weihaiensis]|uniref:hypothetical protein n=1 Tax=Bacillus weihaiensis TaxID=1547283 RepID=UPI0023557B18|nr:hypothetical protein [Bacillus weihaiensis]